LQKDGIIVIGNQFIIGACSEKKCMIRLHEFAVDTTTISMSKII
jgi:hypothetical protein